MKERQRGLFMKHYV